MNEEVRAKMNKSMIDDMQKTVDVIDSLIEKCKEASLKSDVSLNNLIAKRTEVLGFIEKVKEVSDDNA
jgi:hypothetical protein